MLSSPNHCIHQIYTCLYPHVYEPTKGLQGNVIKISLQPLNTMFYKGQILLLIVSIVL